MTSANLASITMDVLQRYGRHELSAEMALHRLLLACRGLDRLRDMLAAAQDGTAAELLRLLAANREGMAQALLILERAEDGAPPASSPEEGVAWCRNLFDWAVGVNPAASVALYSLGDDRRLVQATEEVVGLMRKLGILAPGRHLLDIGCGVGRFETALAPHVAAITGIDVSAAMLREARVRCAGLKNVRLVRISGQDLGPFRDRAFDAAIAVDSFPYLYQAGGAGLVLAFVREVARVLRPGGDLLVLNLSYRGDLAQDRADARAMAAALDLDLLRCGSADLRHWDGLAFHWRKRG